MVPGYVEWCKNCDFFSRIYVFGMLGPRGPLGGAKTVPPSVLRRPNGLVPPTSGLWETRDLPPRDLPPIPLGRFGGTTGGLRPPTWTFAGRQPPSYQTYSDVKPTVRKPSTKSTILEGQTLDSSLPGYVYEQNTNFSENSFFSSFAKLHHTWGSKAACPGMVFTWFWICFSKPKPRLWPNY